MSWESTLDHYGALIEERIKEFFSTAVTEAGRYHPFIARAYLRMENFILRRGKRLASCSTLLTYKGYKGQLDDEIIEVCVGVELYRHSILIHDDLVDMDDLRRGEKTIHEIFKEDFNRRFGGGTAVFLGNITHGLAMRSIANSGFHEERVSKMLALLSRGVTEVNESQILDLLFEYKDIDISEWRVMASKRAASLFKVAILMGALSGGATESEIQILEEAASNMGYAFDIQDDIIDTYAEEEKYGRPPCGDIALSKKPLHVIYALNSMNREKSRILRGLLSKEKLSLREIDMIRTVIRESGGLEKAKEMSKKHAEKAKALFAKTRLHSDVKDFFYNVIDYIKESLDWYE